MELAGRSGETSIDGRLRGNVIRHTPCRRLSEHDMPVGIRERKAFRPVDAVGSPVGNGELRRPAGAIHFGHAQDAGVRFARSVAPSGAAARGFFGLVFHGKSKAGQGLDLAGRGLEQRQLSGDQFGLSDWFNFCGRLGCRIALAYFAV